MKKHPAVVRLDQYGFDHVLVALLCVVVTAVVGTALLVASHALTTQWKGALEMGSSTSGYCLTANGSSNGSKVVLNPCAAAPSNNQTWSLNLIKTATIMGQTGVQEFTLQSSAGTTECLNNPYGSKTNGTQLQVYACHLNDKNNLWVWGAKLTGQGLSAHQLINVATISGTSGLCLDDAYGAKTAGTKVQVYHCKTSGQNNQNWFEGTSSDSGGGSTGGQPSSNVSCNYQVDTWSGDASKVGYSATKVASKDGNPASFSVKMNANKGTNEVVGYPSDQCLLYAALPTNLTSSFKDTPPASSQGLDYEYAYDIWLTTATAAKANNWDNDLELMIWNYVNGQVPAGSVKATLSDGSKVWIDGNNKTGIVSVVLPKNETSGTVNISSITSQLKSLGYVSSTYDGILDVEYGIEAPYGGGQTFSVDSMSVSE